MRIAERGLSLREIAGLVGGRVVGDAGRVVARLAPLDEAGPKDLSLLAHPKYRSEAKGSSAGALLVREGFEMEGRHQVVVKDPHLALALILPRLHPSPPPARGISPRASVAADARLEEDVSVGPFAVIEEGCVIGRGAIIGAACFVGAHGEVGEGTIVHPHTTIYPGCRLGRRVIVHSGTVIGSDGFGYATSGGVHRKIPQVGGVLIEDDVEIGAGVTIDRGSIGTTRVGHGTKIDNLVQIGHNVRIGPNCLIVAQVGISGSTRIGEGTVFAGQSGAAGHLAVGSRVTVASKSAVYEDLPDGSFVAGIPAVDHRVWKRAQVVYARLPELSRRVRELEEKLAHLDRSPGEDPRSGSKGPVRGASGTAKGRRRASAEVKTATIRTRRRRGARGGAGEDNERVVRTSASRTGAGGQPGGKPVRRRRKT
jgi:UDP-3-O-[3-hydroxymyristoyl] glucosamine N-acyltransferase